MIFYATKQTRERYKLKPPQEFSDPVMRQLAIRVSEQERNDRLLEWGMKLFYFDGRKCLLICNFASKFTVVLVNLKMDDLEAVGDIVAHYLLDIYQDDRKTTKLLHRYFSDHPMVCFEKLSDRSIIATLNHMEMDHLLGGYQLYEYIQDGVLHTKQLNRDINQYHLMSEKRNGKKIFFSSKEKFAELLRQRYAR